MPNLVGVFGKRNSRGFLLAARIEQAQLDLGRIAGKDGEVDACPVRLRAELERRSLGHAMAGAAHRRPPCGVNTMTESGGSVTEIECGCPCQASPSASTDWDRRHTRTAVPAVVRVQPQLPRAKAWDTDPIIRAHDGREIANDEYGRCAVAAPAQVRENAVVGVAAVDPGEAAALAIEFVQRGHAPVERIEIAHEALHALVARDHPAGASPANDRATIHCIGRTHSP